MEPAEKRAPEYFAMRHCLLALVLMASIVSARDLSYIDLLNQMTDLDRLARLEPGVVAGQCSSWDRRETESWGPNGDAGQYLAIEPNGECVMADLKGPGCVFRLWSANPKARLRFYFDGATTPTYEWDHNSIYTGTIEPFIKPLVYKRGGPNSASDLYFPLPYAKSLRITAVADNKLPVGQYYYVDYQSYPADWTVPTFRLPLSADELAARDRVAQAWSQSGVDPKPAAPGSATIAKTLTLAPGQTADLADLAGPGEIRSLRVKVTSDSPGWQRKLVLSGTWDDSDWPQVLSPLAPFFGYDWTTADYGSVPLGCLQGTNYCFFVMPFAKRGQLALTSHLEVPVTLDYEVVHAPTAWTADSLYFYARWRHERNAVDFDWPILETAGQGRFVGTSLQIHHPIPGWWGEGDEKVWVDDRDQFPEWIGTGSEDYFGDAWGILYLPGGSWGCSYQQGDHTCCYRWHLVDNIPFTQRLRMTIENYGPNGQWSPMKYYEYNTVAYWYQREVKPPFARLSGLTYLGGDRPGPAPRKVAWNPQTMRAPQPDALFINALGQPATVEAEAMDRPAGSGEVIGDTGRAQPFNYERAVRFASVTPGQVLGEYVLPAEKADTYLVRLVVGSETTAGLAVQASDQMATEIGRPAPFLRDLGALWLPAGRNALRVIATSGGLAVLDALYLGLAPRDPSAMEAESQTIISASSAEPPRAGAPVERALSAGRALEWHAEKVGESFRLRLERPAEQAWTLGVLPLRGPAAGIIAAYLNGHPIGAPLDLYAPSRQRDTLVVPLGQVPAGTQEVEIRMVGKNPASQGMHAGLDYFRWEPKILHPDSAAGVTAQVTNKQGLDYSIQPLGTALDGHQLFLQPASNHSWVEITVTVPETRDYRLAMRLTMSWDYAIAQASLDGQPVGEPVDAYSREVIASPEVDLGTHHLTAGPHTFRLTAAEHNPASAGYLMGLDYLLVK